MQSEATSSLIDPFLTPATLAMSLWPDGQDIWVPQKHLLYASARITHTIMKGDGRLIVSMPPRHGKSRLISESTVPWFLEKFPGREIMFIAYNQEFSEEWSMKAQDIIAGRQDLFSYGLREGRASRERFETTNKCVARFSGISGGQTGKGADLVVIDDYIKDIEQAMSKTERDKMWARFVANIWTRLEPGATIIIVATRWWSDDLIGRILKHLKGWENICFPGIYLPKRPDGSPDLLARDILGRKHGEVLFPQRHPMKRMSELQAAMKVSGTVFDALIQQVPIDDQTDFTDGAWLQVIQGVRTEELKFCRAWDMAATQGGGDFTTGTKMGRKGLMRQAYITNIIRKQLSPLKVEELIRRTAVADGIECEILLEQEPGSQGTALVQHYQRNVLPEFTVIGVPAGNKSKILKAQPFIAAVQSGNVYMVDNSNAPEEPAWIAEFRTEFGEFPPSDGGHDDQVDTASICYNHLYQTEIKSVSWGDAILGGADNSRVAFGIGSYAKIREDLGAVYASDGKGSRLVTGMTW